MRLTLRTLLAYLDDLLEPAQAREIGEKISESGYASALVDRIREVTRRRRLTAPDPKSPNSGLDTNSVAEYLDNTLEPDAVADVEKVCLDSDVHLAEVAASHQILTLVLGEPVDVPARTRERMYALGPISRPAGSNGHIGAEGDSKAGKAGSDSSVAIPVQAHDETSSTDSFTSTIPDYLRPVPLWRRLAPAAVGVMVGGIWLSVVYSDPSLWFKKSPDAGDTSSTIDSAVDADSAVAMLDKDGSALPPEQGSAAADQLSPVGEPTEPMSKEPNSAVSARPPRDIAELNGFDPDTRTTTSAPTQPAPTAPGTPLASTTPLPVPPSLPEPTLPAVGTSVIAASTPASAGSSVTAPSTTVPLTTPTSPAAGVTAEPEASVISTVPAPEVLYTSREGVLAQKTDEGWVMMPHRTIIRAGDRVASLEPFSALLEISSLNLVVELQGGSVVEFLGATKDEQVSLKLLTGRISVQRRSAETNTEPVVVGLYLLDEPCRLTLHTPNVLCGAELTAAEANAYEKELGENRYTGNLFIVNGRVSFAGKIAGDVDLTGPSWFPLTPLDRRAMSETSNHPPLLTVPEWLDPAASRISSTERRYASRFQNEIDEEQPLRNSIPSIVKSKIPSISELAVKTMATIDMHDQLVQVLAEAEFLEARNAAITGLQRWLPAAAENREILRAALQRHFPTDQVDPLYRLLWGYNEEDARNPATSQLLVDWLGHDNQVIRQLAFQQIYRLTGQRYDYRPINPANQRKVALDRWHAHLERNKGALLE
ncbi:MAG: hypothetical protein HQ518_26780 [Rhodopirellula sp.]|nr:hypothetical protein [Rhodopirellula sp.]